MSACLFVAVSGCFSFFFDPKQDMVPSVLSDLQVHNNLEAHNFTSSNQFYIIYLHMAGFQNVIVLNRKWYC